ncbi:ABC transporter permease [Tomitella gaofuii]|uniref:ABC transporter permease n=1 Tax=Tomitella gaofuii TaxID=2760083 RepID=UPI0015FE048E|nr:ABC transporter permease [Tomitella gaofuii]
MPGRNWIGAATVLGILAAWQLLSATGVLPGASIPSAASVIEAGTGELASSEFWSAMWDTVSVALLGMAVIVVLAVPAALLIGRVRWIGESTWFLVEFLKPIPPVALIPLGLLLWGPSPEMKLYLVALGSVWPLLTQVVYGVREIDGVALEMARSYRLGWWKTTSRIVVPSILPFGMTGLRVSASIAIIIAVVVEMIGGAAGLGQQITLAQSANALPRMYALIIATGLLGLAVNALFRCAERPLLFWHPSHHREAR